MAIFSNNAVFSQSLNLLKSKPTIGIDEIEKWPFLTDPAISDDGNYALFFVDNKPKGGRTLIIRSVSNNWDAQIQQASQAKFAHVIPKVIFILPGDTLAILSLPDSTLSYREHVKSYKLANLNGEDWLAYLSSDNKLFLLNLRTLNQKEFKDVINYQFNERGNVFLMQSVNKNDSLSPNLLQWFDVKSSQCMQIWKGGDIRNMVFDDEGMQLVFVAPDKTSTGQDVLWYFRPNMPAAVVKISRNTPGFPQNCMVHGSDICFNKNGNKISFKLNSVNKTPVYEPKVNIWSYKDAKLQSQQLEELNRQDRNRIDVIFNFSNDSVIRLTSETEKVISPIDKSRDLDYVLIQSKNGCDYQESYWNQDGLAVVYLVSTHDGSRTELSFLKNSKNFRLSPNAKYIVFYVSDCACYYSYEIASKKIQNITKGATANWTFERQQADDKESPIFYSCWSPTDSFILIHDQYDLWQLDVTGKKKPLNLTNHFGTKHHIQFLMFDQERFKIGKEQNYVLLSALNTETKDNGFFRIELNKEKDPEKLTMAPYLFNWLWIEGGYYLPIKAKNKNLYLVRRMSATESPNFFITEDFKSFRQLSNLQPQKEVNWLTTELITWKTFDGKTSKGVLYKPENFNPSKAYPLIIYFYEKLSDELNLFKTPEISGAIINIPFYVSNGYLVFQPDIHYTVGAPANSVYSSVVSAASYLMKKPWINALKVGIQGHSFGGYEVNSLVTRTNIFAAAMSGSGISDLVSLYGGTSFGGKSEQFQTEHTQLRIGATLWKRPDLYIENSPVFKANKVTTPILLLANRSDANVPFTQGLEFFNALRRLKKPVWMLEYENEQHLIVLQENQMDYTIRVKQFFDYYLMDAPQPKWMSESIPARLRGYESGL